MPITVGGVVKFPEAPPQERDIISQWCKVGDPLVTVLCPTYNQVNFIRHAINGILKQKTHFAFEVIVRDDGSQDGTREVVMDYQSRYPKIIRPILELNNTWSQGVPIRESMVQMARGQYIALCDGDDFWTDSNKLASQVEILEVNESVSLVHHEAFRFEDDRIITDTLHHERSRRNLSRDDLSKGIGAMPLTMCFRKSAWDWNAVETPHVTNGDTFLITQLSRHGGSYYIPKIMAAYRRTQSGMWSGRSQQSRHFHIALSSLWIARYHSRNDNRNVADFWVNRAALNIFRLVRGEGDVISRRALSLLARLCVKDAARRIFLR